MAGVNPSPPARTAADRCPGVLRPHLAADGAMIRVRVPGGQTTGVALAALSAIARRYGSGLLQLTSRASVQLRGLPVDLPSAVANEIAAAGFLPSAEHERVRNITASPLTGLTGGRADLRGMVADLDRGLVADPTLVDLPGRFLFGLDDGRGDVAGLASDVAYLARGTDHGVVTVGADEHRVTADQAVRVLLDAARQFLAERPGAGTWPVRDRCGTPTATGAPMTTPLGAIEGHASVTVPLGRLRPEQVTVLAEVSSGGPVVITPWRGLVVPAAADRLPELSAAGLITDDDSVWTLLSACVGAPWCASGRADTQRWAMDLAASGGDLPRTHLSGCERRCGAPTGAYRDLVAP